MHNVPLVRPECSRRGFLRGGRTVSVALELQSGHWRILLIQHNKALTLLPGSESNTPRCGAGSGGERGRGREGESDSLRWCEPTLGVENQCLEGGVGGVLHYSSKEQFETKEMTVRVFPVDGGYVMQW